MKERTYKLTIAYVGTNYCGWQVQPGELTIQGVIEQLLLKLFRKRVVLRYASRTDSGVHALAQMATFTCESDFSPEKIQQILNTQLPNDIVIKEVELATDDFDVRKTTKKTYYYLIDTSEIRDPFMLGRAWWAGYKLNKNVMLECLKLFLGKHDFNAFMASGSEVKTTIRSMYDIRLSEEGVLIRISFTGDGFLKQMIRNIVGTVVDAGRGRFTVEDVKKILGSKDRRNAGITAPPYGLYLESISYEL